MQSVSTTTKIETEILRASSMSEFSHSLGQKRKCRPVNPMSALPPESGHSAALSACPFRAKVGSEPARDHLRREIYLALNRFAVARSQGFPMR